MKRFAFPIVAEKLLGAGGAINAVESKVLACAWLEPVSKSFEEDEEAGELHEAKEVLRIKLPADKNATLPLNPRIAPVNVEIGGAALLALSR